jgi:hypothetical protein
VRIGLRYENAAYGLHSGTPYSTTSAFSSSSVRRGGMYARFVSSAMRRVPSTVPARIAATCNGFTRMVSILKMRSRPSRSVTRAPISSSISCMRLRSVDIDMSSGLWWCRIERNVDKPTQIDFHPPWKPRNVEQLR